MLTERRAALSLSTACFFWFIFPASPAAAKPFAFAVFADNQQSEYLIKYSRVFHAIVEDITRRQPAFVITVGDHIRGYIQSEAALRRMWREYVRAVEPLKPAPVYAIPGNHDLYDELSGKLWDEYMGKRYFSWEHENNLFVALDAETDVNAVTGAQFEWLKKLLSRAGDYENVFVSIHKPLFRPWIDGKLDDWDMNLYTRPKEAEALLALVAKSGVKMSFSGHYHMHDIDYRHGILQFITGGAGGALEDIPGRAFFHYLWVEVDGKKVDVTVVRPDLAKVGEAGPHAALPVVGVDVLPERGRRPFPGFVFTDYSKMPAAGGTFGDGASQCGGKFEKRGKTAVFSFSSGPGWGCGVNLERPEKDPVDVAGASRIVLRLSASRGVRFQVSVHEDGVGPQSATSFAGARGADGEAFGSADLTGTGGMKDYEVELPSLVVSPGYGNPAGNERLDAQAVAGVTVGVAGGQGPGEMVISRVRFE